MTSQQHTWITPAAAKRTRRRRYLVDKLARWSITTGGLGVIGAILLIFLYLIYEVEPLFEGASLDSGHAIQLPETITSAPVLLALDEQVEIAVRLGDQGDLAFFSAGEGTLLSSALLPVPEGRKPTSMALGTPESHLFAAGYDDGRVVVAKYDFNTRYNGSRRVIEPELQFPYGEAPLPVAETAQPLRQLAIRDSDDDLAVAGVLDSGRIAISRFTRKVNLMTDEAEVSHQQFTLPSLGEAPVRRLLISPDLRWLYVLLGENELVVLDIRSAKPGLAESLVDRQWLTASERIEDVDFLLGGISLLASTASGDVLQWMMVRQPDNHWKLSEVRSFDLTDAPVRHVATEQRRKGFATLDDNGTLGIHNSTAHRTVLLEPVVERTPLALAISPRANAVLAETDDRRLTLWRVDNPHPEVSWSSLWSRVWYEGYDKPEYIWQSSASNNDFEPKLSLTPLVFGTLKAALFAMVVAIPLAICGAIFTANFMAPGMRRKVKPLIEMMAALPTVVIGFFAGLWLAPYLEKHLAGLFVTLIGLPPLVLLAAFLWSRLPQNLRLRIPAGWEAALLVPVIVLGGVLLMQSGFLIESLFFTGDMRLWLANDMGMAYDSRNALVVGLAMGIAVTPIIFSIAEDAIFSVPKHLVFGSLALGATPWQTLVGVVLPTASPGIFSALMIGLGRAVGETMIVLMATGNTPVMDWSMFQGLRTLAANIAVEVPEAEVASTHYRVLFLAALVLFMFTFMVNTLAEWIRHRLRQRYGNL